MDIQKAFLMSLVLHCLLLYTAKGHGSSASGDSSKPVQSATNNPTSDKDSLKDKPTEVDLVENPIQKEPGELAKKKSHKADTCNKSFGGVGIAMNLLSVDSDEAVVTHVYRGYPADLAGVQNGDYILNAHEAKGPIGTDIVLEIVRDGIKLNLSVKREKICMEDMKESQ